MEQALQSMIDNMPEKTGKSLQQWFVVLAGEKFEKHMQGVAILKGQYGVSHGFANTIVTLYRQHNEQEEDLLSVQYKGKENLKPIYDKLDSILRAFGGDVVVTPKKGSVSFIRKHQFALVKPATKSRIDLGLKIKDQEPQGLLEDSGPFGTMCTHRIQLKSIDDIDDEVSRWLELAYSKSV